MAATPRSEQPRPQPPREPSGELAGKRSGGSGLFGDTCPVAVAVDPFQEAVVVIDGGGKIVLADQGVEQLLGSSPQELIGRPIECLIPAGLPAAGVDRPAAGPGHDRRADVAVARDGQQLMVRIEVRTAAAADGQLTAVVIRPAGGDQYWPECRQHLQLSQRVTRMGSWEQLLPDGPMRWSQQMYSLLGVEPGEVTPSQELLHAHVHPDDLPALSEQVLHARAHGGRIYAEVRLIRPDRAPAADTDPMAGPMADPMAGPVAGPVEVPGAGAVTVVAVAGAVEPDRFGRLRSIGTVQDITDRRSLQQRLRVEDQLLRLAFDQAPLGMCMVSTRPGRIGTLIRVNQALCELVGRPEQELLGRPSSTVLISEDAQESQRLREQILSGQLEIVDGVERRIDRPDGTHRWVRLTSTLVRGPDGAPDYLFVHQILDVTDSRARRQEELQRTLRDQRIAEVLQADLLPRVPGWVGPVQVASRYQPAGSGEAVGGDWHDVFALPYDRIGIVIGDVAGHGIESAATMTQLRYAVRMLATTGASPADVTVRLNQMMHGLGHDEVQLATLVHAQLDVSAGTLTYASAGHPPLLLLAQPDQPDHPDGSARPEVRQLPVTGDPPLGAVADVDYRQHTVALTAGSRLIGFTDGLIERRDRDLDDCLNGLVDRLAGLPAHVVADPQHLAEHILAATPPGPREDDTALLVLAIPAPRPLFSDRALSELNHEGTVEPTAASPDVVDLTILDPTGTRDYLRAAHRRLVLRTGPERQLRRATHLEVLANCSRAAQQSPSLAEADLERVLRQAAHVLGGCLLAFRLDGGQAGLLAVANTDPVIETLQRDLYTATAGPPITYPGNAPADGLIVQHVDAAQLIGRHGEAWRSYAEWLHGSTVVWLPMAAHGITLGLLGAQRRTPLDADEIDFLTDLADRLALVEHHRRLTAERDQATRELAASRTRFRLAFDNAPFGMALASLDPTYPGRYLMVNRAMCDLTGYPPEALVGMSFRDLTHPDDQAEDAVQARELVTGARRLYRREKRLVRADGTVIWVRMSATPTQDADGIRYVVGHVEPIPAPGPPQPPPPPPAGGGRQA